MDPWDCIGDDSSRLFSNFVRERTCRAGKCAGSEAWTRNWRSIGCRVASKRRNEGSQPGNFVFSGLAAAVRDGADAVAGRYDAGRMPGCVGCLSRLRSGAGMAAGRIYWLGRFLGTACICGDVISTGGVLYSCVLAASFLGACKGEADTDGWIFNPFIGAGDGNCAGSVAESWFCIITGLTLPILMGLSE